MRRLVTLKQREQLCIEVVDVESGFEPGGLKVQRAVAEPVVLGHALDQNGFGGCGRLVFGDETFHELLVFEIAFGGEYGELAAGARTEDRVTVAGRLVGASFMMPRPVHRRLDTAIY